MKDKVNITIKLNYDTFSKMASFNLKNNINKIDLNHLPFRKFDYVVYEQVNSSDIEEFNKLISQFKFDKNKVNGFVNYHKNKAKNKEKSEVRASIDATTNVISINIMEMVLVQIETKNGTLTVHEGMGNDISAIKYVVLSPILDELFTRSKEDKDVFDNFIMECIADVIHLILYISADKKVSISKEDLFTTKETIEKKTKKGKNGKRKKASVTYIKNIECVISSKKVTENINNMVTRNYNRQTESWFTKGFWRTYKSGKKVWIKPTIRKARTSTIGAATVDSNINKVYVVQ